MDYSDFDNAPDIDPDEEDFNMDEEEPDIPDMDDGMYILQILLLCVVSIFNVYICIVFTYIYIDFDQDIHTQSSVKNDDMNIIIVLS